MQSMLSVAVIDPCNRTGKVTVPAQYILPTRGSQDYFQGNGAKDLSLCLLFQKDRCNAGVKCHQIHADRTFVTKLREQAATASNCCCAHGDLSSAGFAETPREVVIISAEGVPTVYPLSCFARTQFLDQILRTNSATCRVTASKLCRLHGDARCKFGRDCKNIHFCRSVETNPVLTAKRIPAATPAPVVERKQPSPVVAVAHDLSILRSSNNSVRSVTPPIRPACALDIDDDVSSVGGVSTRSNSVFSTPGKALSLCPSLMSVPSITVPPAPKLNSVVLSETVSENLLMRPLKMSLSPATGIFCADGFETSIRSLCDDFSAIDVPSMMSPSWTF